MKKLLASFIVAALLSACSSDNTVIVPVTFNDISGWRGDKLAEPFGMFVDSCQVNANRSKAYQSKNEGPIGVRSYWQRACSEAANLGQPDDALARRFFESNFQPYKIETESQKQGLVTGYYEPIINGSRTRGGKYLTPVYGVPSDLGQRKPYYTRAQILNGALKGKAQVLFYVDDPVLLFFLHVQGSGKVRLPDGSLTGLQYAGQNGYKYTGIGAILRDRGELTTLSMQSIRDWLLSHPSQMDEVMNQNESYVFFKHSPGDKVAKGALGIPLTPLRSIAVDAGRATYGVPTFLDGTQSEYLTGRQIPFQRLMLSQDTGGAIKGPHRADLFYGQGTLAEWQAGHQNSRANVYWLLPLGMPTQLVLPAVPDASMTLPETGPVVDEMVIDPAMPLDGPAPVVIVPSDAAAPQGK